MIGFIQGKALDTDGKKAIVLTDSGIGYELNYGYFLDKHSEVALFIHHHISENDQSLWGFNTLEDKKMFELLKTVNKVGSSKAYPLITVVGTKQVIQAIMFEQADVLSSAPGIGKKMAEQIILSLKDKIEKFNTTELGGQGILVSDNNSEEELNPSMMKDVMLALDSLGYKDKDISKLVRKQVQAGFSSSEDIIKNVLRDL